LDALSPMINPILAG